MRKLRQSTARNVMILMVQSSDHITGLASLTLTITASKDGGAFGSITPTVTDRGSGWYNLALTTSHTDTLGDFALHITGTSADPSDMVFMVEAGSVDADVSSRSTYAGGAVASVTAAVTLPSIPANWITAAGINASALNGKGDWLLSGSYTAPDNTNIGNIVTTLGVAGAGLTALGDTRIAKLDATVSSRSTYAGGAVASVTAAVNANVATINGVTILGDGNVTPFHV